MSIEKELMERANSACELCTATENLNVFAVAPKAGDYSEECVLICQTCQSQIEGNEPMNANHFRSLNDAIWNTEPAVQVMSWRILNELKAEGWTGDLMDMMYMEPETEVWAKAVLEEKASAVVHRDSNGVILEAGDTVVLTQDLNVKGASLVAKRGMAVRRISLDRDNAEYIEGKVDGQHVVILTKFVKKMK
jgi:protein PhnA